MKSTLSAVRAYVTNAGYGREPRESPPGSPVEVSAFPKRGWTTTIWLGAPVPWILDAEGFAQAALRTFFTGELGRAQNADPVALQRLTELRESLGPTGKEGRWWVTIVCEQQVDVPDDEWLDRPFIWVSPRVTDGMASEARTKTSRAIDVLAGFVASTMPNAITGAPLFDRVFMRSGTRQPFPLLTPGAFPPSVHVSSSVPVDASGLGRAMRGLRPVLDRLESSFYWWARSIEEPDDWRRFQFQYLALEILVAKMEQVAKRAVLPTLRVGDGAAGVVPPQLLGERLTPAISFALVALMLSPKTAADDSDTFASLKSTRDRASHGGVTIGETLPTAVAGALLARYLSLAVRPEIPEAEE